MKCKGVEYRSLCRKRTEVQVWYNVDGMALGKEEVDVSGSGKW